MSAINKEVKTSWKVPLVVLWVGSARSAMYVDLFYKSYILLQIIAIFSNINITFIFIELAHFINTLTFNKYKPSTYNVLGYCITIIAYNRDYAQCLEMKRGPGLKIRPRKSRPWWVHYYRSWYQPICLSVYSV